MGNNVDQWRRSIEGGRGSSHYLGIVCRAFKLGIHSQIPKQPTPPPSDSSDIKCAVLNVVSVSFGAPNGIRPGYQSSLSIGGNQLCFVLFFLYFILRKFFGSGSGFKKPSRCMSTVLHVCKCLGSIPKGLLEYLLIKSLTPSTNHFRVKCNPILRMVMMAWFANLAFVIHSPPGTAGSQKRDTKSSRKDDADEMDMETLDIDDDSDFFNKFTKPGTLPPTGNHRSSPKNTLSEDSLKLPAGRKLYEKGRKYGFCPITTFSSDPTNRVTCLVISTFPPDDDCQGIAKYGPFYTRILTNVKNGKAVYTSFDCIQQNPAIHAFSRTTHQVVQDKCNILRKTAKFVCDESIAWMDRSPFPAPYNQGDPKHKAKFAHYKKMKKDFDPLVAEYIKEIIESKSLLPNLRCVILLGDVWDFATVQYPNMIDPSLIIQHCPVIHPTVIDHYYPTPRQGYTYYECMSNVTDFLRTGTTDFRDTLVPWDDLGDMFAFGKTKNDGNEGTTSGTTGGGGSDHFVYIGRYDGYTGGDNTVFVGYNRSDFEQLMKDGKFGKGCPDIDPQEKLLKRPQKMDSLGLTIEIEHFHDYYERRGKQMRLSDWGVQNREGAYKAWVEYVDGKRAEGDRKRSGKMSKMVGAVLNAAKSS